jgi:hypothetical protein
VTDRTEHDADATPLRPADEGTASLAVAILLRTLEERVPGTLAVLSHPATRDAAWEMLDRRLREAMIELGYLPGDPEPPAA